MSAVRANKYFAGVSLPPGRDLLPAIGYVRVSMLREEQISPAIQRDAITGWAIRNGFYISDENWIEDLDVSGRTFQRRIMDAIAKVEQGLASAIVLWKFSRFGRTRTGNQLNLGRVEAAGGQLISATEEVDARTAVGKLTRGVLMELAAFESDRAGEQWAEAFQNRLARGLPPLGGEYFGYVRRGRQSHPLYKDRTIPNPADGPERYEPDADSGLAAVSRDVHLRIIEGASLRSQAWSLNRREIYTPGGAPWSGDTLGSVLDSGFAAGLIRIHDPECQCRKASACKQRVHVPGAQEPLLTATEWHAYQAARRKAAPMAPKARVPMFPLTGLIVCGHCGGGMHRWGPCNTHPRRDAYLCGSLARNRGAKTDVKCGTRYVSRLLVEQAVLEVLAEWAPEIEAAAEAAVDEILHSDAVELEIAKVRGRLTRLDKDLARQTDQVSRGVIPEALYMPARDRLLSERAEIEAALKELEAEPDQEEVDPLDCAPKMLGIVEEWVTLEVVERAAALRQVLTKVEVFRPPRKRAWIVIHAAWGESRERTIPVRGEETHCKKGHPYDPPETYVREAKGRYCRECRREQDRRKYREAQTLRQLARQDARGEERDDALAELRPPARRNQTHCAQGHAYDPPESYGKRRTCRVCRQQWARKRRQELKAMRQDPRVVQEFLDWPGSS